MKEVGIRRDSVPYDPFGHLCGTLGHPFWALCLFGEKEVIKGQRCGVSKRQWVVSGIICSPILPPSNLDNSVRKYVLTKWWAGDR